MMHFIMLSCCFVIHVKRENVHLIYIFCENSTLGVYYIKLKRLVQLRINKFSLTRNKVSDEQRKHRTDHLVGATPSIKRRLYIAHDKT